MSTKREVLSSQSMEDLITLLDEEIGQPTRKRPIVNGKPFGITVNEYAKKKFCTMTISRRLLEEAVKSGILDKIQMVDGQGSSPFVYFQKGAEIPWREDS